MKQIFNQINAAVDWRSQNTHRSLSGSWCCAVALASRALDFSDEENLSITASCDDVARAVRRAENVVTGHSRQD